MKTLISSLFALAIATSSIAGPEGHQPYKGTPAFERMKTLAGTWKGTMDMGQGPTEIAVEYRIVAGGSALEERTFAGTPREMITIYHDKNDKLALTHYCMLHNQPGMTLANATDSKLAFEFDELCGIDATTEMHMHSMSLIFNDDGTITYLWNMLAGGEAQKSPPYTLSRVES